MNPRRLFQFRHRVHILKVPSGTLTIGRQKSCDLVIDNGHASRVHSRIVVGDQSAAIEDLESANGVKVNGKPISGLHVLRVGDRIEIANETIEVLGYGPAVTEPIDDDQTIVDAKHGKH